MVRNLWIVLGILVIISLILLYFPALSGTGGLGF